MMKRMIMILLILFLLAFLWSCVGKTPETPETFEPEKAYDEVTHGAFKPGAIMISTDPEWSQLDEGSFVYIVTTSGLYGYMKVLDIEDDSIVFNYALFDTEGDVFKHEEDVLLKADKGIDMDNDSFDDVLFSSEKKRKSFDTSIRYLVFPRYTDVSSMFSADLKKIKGIISLSTSGSLITVSDGYALYEGIEPSTNVVAFVKTENLPSFEEGDFIIDVLSSRKTGRGYFRKITKVEDHGTYVLIHSTPTSFNEAFGRFKLHAENITLDEMTPINEDAKILLETMRKADVELEKTISLIDTSNVKASLDISLGFGVSVDADLDLDGLSLKHFLFRADFDFEHSLVLEALLTVSYEREDTTSPFFEPSFYFIIGEIPIEISFPVYAGYDLDADATVQATAGYNVDLSFYGGVEATSWSNWRTISGHEGESELVGPEFEIEGEASFKPYLGIGMRVSVAYVAFVEGDVRPYVEIGGEGHVYASGDGYVDCSLDIGMEFTLGVGIDLVLYEFREDWTIFDWTIKSYDLELWKQLACPSNLRASFESDGVHLSWTDRSILEDGYEIQRGRKNVLGTVVWMKIGEVGENVTSFIDQSPESDVVLHYKVRAFADTSFGKTYSDWSESATTINHSPNTPYNPSPQNGAVDVSLTPILSWECEDPDWDSVRYDIYLGTTSPPPLLVSDYPYKTYTITTPLSYDTTYYWRIVAKDDKGGVKHGPIWNFKTLLPGHYILTIDTYPDEGLAVSIDSTPGISPFSLSVVEGDHTVSVTSPQMMDRSTFVDGEDTLYLFKSWNDGVTSATRVVYVDRDITLTANMLRFFKVIVDVEPTGAGTVIYTRKPDDLYFEGTSVIFQAIPASGYNFLYWELNSEIITTNPLEWEIHYPIHLIAKFQ